MNTTWIPLRSIPPAGKELVLDDQSVWLEPLREFGLACRILDPIRAVIFVHPQEQGVLFTGTVSGRVALPCDRCAEESDVSVNHRFDSFEPYPPDPAASSGKARHAPGDRLEKEAAPAENQAEDSDEAVIRYAAHGRGIEINPAALAWEEFSLALPVKPLCRSECKGLCPSCGMNMNTESCDCEKEPGDPRLAALRALSVTKKQQ